MVKRNENITHLYVHFQLNLISFAVFKNSHILGTVPNIATFHLILHKACEVSPLLHFIQEENEAYVCAYTEGSQTCYWLTGSPVI